MAEEGADLSDPQTYFKAGLDAAEEMGLELVSPEERETMATLARDHERRAEGIADLMRLRGQQSE